MDEEEIKAHRQWRFQKTVRREKENQHKRMRKVATRHNVKHLRTRRMRRLRLLYIPTVILLVAGVTMTIFGTIQGLGEGTFFWRHRREFYTTGSVLLAVSFVMLLVAEGLVTREDRLQSRIAGDLSVEITSSSDSEEYEGQNNNIDRFRNASTHTHRLPDPQPHKKHERLLRKPIPLVRLGAMSASAAVLLEPRGLHKQDESLSRKYESLSRQDAYSQTVDIDDVSCSVMLGAKVACLLLNDGFMSAEVEHQPRQHRRLNIKTAIYKGSVTMDPIWETEIAEENRDSSNIIDISRDFNKMLHDENRNISISDDCAQNSYHNICTDADNSNPMNRPWRVKQPHRTNYYHPQECEYTAPLLRLTATHSSATSEQIQLHECGENLTLKLDNDTYNIDGTEQ